MYQSFRVSCENYSFAPNFLPAGLEVVGKERNIWNLIIPNSILNFIEDSLFFLGFIGNQMPFYVQLGF